MKKHKTSLLSGNRRGLYVFLALIAVLCIGTSLWSATHQALPKGIVEIRFLDAGQADSTRIVTEEGVVLIDTGLAADAPALHTAVMQYNNRLSALIITHAHSDHMGGAAYILEHMRVDCLYLPAVSCTPNAYHPLTEIAEARGTTVIYCETTTSFRLGDTRFTILAPLSLYEDENNNSLVVRMDFGTTSALFTGDAEAESEADQLALYQADSAEFLRADILKVGHHGSDTSSTMQYLQAVMPSYAVISCGKDNTYGHPAATILQRLEEIGAAVLRTDLDGPVTLRTNGTEITVLP